MALDETHFFYADRGATSVYKFRVEGDDTIYVWFDYGEDGGALHTTPNDGPYDVNHPLGAADHEGLDALLQAKGTTTDQWVKDLMAQYGERVAWTYP